MAHRIGEIGPSRYNSNKPGHARGHIVHKKKRAASGGAIGAAGVQAAARKAGIILQGRFGL